MAVNFLSNATLNTTYYMSHLELTKVQSAARRASLDVIMEVWYSKEEALRLHTALKIYKADETIAEFREFLKISEGFLAY